MFFCEYGVGLNFSTLKRRWNAFKDVFRGVRRLYTLPRATRCRTIELTRRIINSFSENGFLRTSRLDFGFIDFAVGHENIALALYFVFSIDSFRVRERFVLRYF